jgi:threonine synthase
MGARVKNPDTIATAIRIGNPASWDLALAAREDSDGYFGAISDADILVAHRLLSREMGVFVEPSSAISVAGLLERAQAGVLKKGATAVLTVTGHGLKDPSWALKDEAGKEITPTKVPIDVSHIAEVLGLGANSA